MGELASHYSHTGRPSIDPELMLRMLLLGDVFAIRSERQLAREVQVNLAYRWFCGLGIQDKVPDHSAFSRVRNDRFRQSNILRELFERVVADCIARQRVGGEGFAVDASLIEADANTCRSIPGKEWNKDRNRDTASRAVREYLDTLDDKAFRAARDVAREIAQTKAFEATRRHRKKVEVAFAHLKLILRMGRLRLRGPTGAQDEFTPAAIAQNLRKLARRTSEPKTA